MANGNNNDQPTMTLDQFLSLQAAAGHVATQEQLDNVRSELDAKIENNRVELSAKIDSTYQRLDSKIDKIMYLLITLLIAAVSGGFFILDTISKLHPPAH